MSDLLIQSLIVFLILDTTLACGESFQLEIEDGYNLNKRPVRNDNYHTVVNASINVRNILGVDEKAQIISLETTLRFFWYDERIKPKTEHLEGGDYMGNYTSLNPCIAEKIWMPDVFIDQAKIVRTPKYFMKTAAVRVYENSLIRYSSRLNFDVACNMDFHLYPVDIQNCEIKFESYDNQAYQMKLNWLPGKRSLMVNKNITLAQFEYRVRLANEYSTDYYDTEYPGLIMNIVLTRQLGYHIVQTFIPSALFVVLAWFSLFIPAEAVPGRVGMVMTTMLTLIAMFASVRYNVPPVSYCSSLDIWMLFCIIFVFSTILEFIIVTTLNKHGHKVYSEQFETICKVAIPCLFFTFTIIYSTIVHRLNKHLSDYIQSLYDHAA